MLIRHSLQLLEHLSDLEERIRYWELCAREAGVELESDTLLRLAFLTELKEGS
jgi:hypothetical protein